jgi:hypothetical protein
MSENPAPAIFEIQGLDQITNFTFNLIEICVFLAILTLMVVEAVKYLRKGIFHRVRFKEWAEQLDFGQTEFLPETRRLSTEDLVKSLRLRPYMFRLPRRLFMKQVENGAQVVASNAATYPYEFEALTRGAAKEHQRTVVEWSAGKLSLRHDEELDASPETSLDFNYDGNIISQSDLTLAMDATGAALERNLDDLQLEVGLRWGLRVRFFALLVGVFLGTVLAGYLWYKGINESLSEVWILPLMGLIAGFLASLLYDLVSRLLGKRGSGV